MSEGNDLIEQFSVKKDEKWIPEDSVELETLKKSILKISRIVYNGEEPPKRCLAISKNKKSLAYDLEMVPVVIVAMLKVTPNEFIPKEFRELMTRLRKAIE